jgi:LPS-assembly protein
MVCKKRDYFTLFLLIFLAPLAYGQQGKRELFQEDLPAVRRDEEIKRSNLLTAEKPTKESIDVIAPNLEFNKESGKAKAYGGVVVSKGGLSAQGEEADVDTKAEEAEIYDDVIFSESQGNFRASSAYINFQNEIGIFNDAEFNLESSSIFCRADTALKYSENKYRLTTVNLTTCGCPDGTVPWSIGAGTADLTQEGYAKLYDATFNVYGVPLLYSPYFSFPLKIERASGILIPTYGISNQDGFKFELPIYSVLNDSSDLTLSPFLATRSRVGVKSEFRNIFSRRNVLHNKLLYSNEGLRDGALRGIVETPTNNPQIDTDRLGLFHSHTYSSDDDATIPISFLSDIHYVSDDQILRELPDQDLGLTNAQFTSSLINTTALLGDYFLASVSGEYNQVIDGDTEGSDDRIFQRAPEFSLTQNRTFRPFGSNPLGIKFTTFGGVNGGQFIRKEGYEGSRVNFNPGVRMPLRYKNYFNSTLAVRPSSTFYDVNNQTPEDVIGDSPSRTTATVNYDATTTFERIYEMNPDGLLAKMSGLGAANQSNLLMRSKHTIQPFAGFLYAPETKQGDLPLFNAVDRVAGRRLATYGFTTALMGRYLPRDNAKVPMPEIAPLPEDLTQISSLDSIPSLPFAPRPSSVAVSSLRQGEIRRLLSLTMKQSYDFLEEEKDLQPNRDPFSDIFLGLNFDPNSSFSFANDLNYSQDRNDLSSFSTTLFFFDDRQDMFRIRYNYVNTALPVEDPDNRIPDISNIETALEAVLTEQTKLGYYVRFDEEKGDVIEQMAALRFLSGCKCWAVDVGVSERVNPDRQQFNVRFSFPGLGDLSQNVFQRVPRPDR